MASMFCTESSRAASRSVNVTISWISGENTMEHTINNNNKLIFRFLLASGLVYVVMAVFAGLPGGANLAPFLAGLVILFLVILALLSFGWFAVIKPLPENLAPSKTLPLSHGLRQGVALFLVMMSGVGMAGGMWDITWHVHSGLPFGEDFFWEPHQFIYVALFAPIVVAVFLWFRLVRHSSGTMRQRLKADIPLTVIITGGIFMLIILPADPLWHLIYGEDLTGLSVPHLVFSISSALTTVGALSILLSYTPVRQIWGSIFKLNAIELLIILALSFNFNAYLMPTLGDWEAITLSTNALPRLPALIEARPDWALPFLAALASMLPASMALAITKRVGAATLTWLIAAVVRSSLFLAFGYGDTGMVSMFLVLPFVIALDFAAWYRASRNLPVSSLFTAAVATIVGAVAVLPQIALFYPDPILSVNNIPLMVAAIFVAALTASWMGGVLGGIIFNTTRFELPAEQPVIARPVARTLSAITLAIVSVAVFFIMNSTLPGA